MGWLLYGFQPVVVVIVLRALLALLPTGARTPVAWGLAGLALAGGLLGVHPLLILGGAAVAMLAGAWPGGGGDWRRWSGWAGSMGSGWWRA